MLETFNVNKSEPAIIWHDKEVKYEELLRLYDKVKEVLSEKKIQNKVVALEADFSPISVAALLCLIELGCIIVPLTKSVEGKKPRFKEIA